MKKQIKLYFDENVPTAIVTGLRLRGLDVLTTKDAGMLIASDEEHIDFAKKEERVIFTQDDDFLRLHAKGIDHCGIVYAHQGTPIGNVIRGLVLIYQVLDGDEMRNHLEFL